MNFCRLELQASNNTAAIQLEALRNRTDIISKIDNCCCELKDKISNSECAIKESIAITEANRLREELQAANMRNLIAEARYGGRCGRNENN
jgi:hypothetical protein